MWTLASQDEFASNLVDRWVHVADIGDAHRSDGFTFVRTDDGLMALEVGGVGERLLRGYRQAVAALARAGNDVVVDEAKFDAGGWSEWSSSLRGLESTWIRVDCDLEVCEERERKRSDRALLQGLARGLYERVHTDVEYDFEVDTSHSTPEECAEAVLAFVEAR